MILHNTPIEGLYVLEPKTFRDTRGYFTELYNQKTFFELGITANFLQDNQSKSTYGVIRGLHYQLEPYAQAKLVRAVVGKIFDVAVDLRKNSLTFGKWYGILLSDENLLQLFIPKGFAHGFSVLSETAIVNYKCDNFYHATSEQGIYFADSELNIDWKLPINDAIVSEKDKNWPPLNKAIYNF